MVTSPPRTHPLFARFYARVSPMLDRQLSDRRAELLTGLHGVVDGAAEQLPAESGSVDAVVASLVLCSVEDPTAALREACRVLRPGFHIDRLERFTFPSTPRPFPAAPHVIGSASRTASEEHP